MGHSPVSAKAGLLSEYERYGSKTAFNALKERQVRSFIDHFQSISGQISLLFRG
jgi:hypothetical protein